MTATIGIGFDDLFERAFAGLPCWVTDRAGRRHDLPVHRWLGGVHASPSDREIDEALLNRCTGPTVDLGCGPGRLVAELLSRGTKALGVDSSAVAVRHTVARGGRAVQSDIHGVLPGAGRWEHVLLADGNVGIGGDPVRLLARSRELLTPTGRVVVELAPHGVGLWCADVRIETEQAVGDWFPWAQVGVDAAADVAAAAGMTVLEVSEVAGSYVATMGRA